MFAVAPAIAALVPGADISSHAFLGWWSAVFAVLASLWIWKWRDSLVTTLVNRRLVSALVFMFFGQSVLAAGGWLCGITVPQVFVMMQFLYFVLAAGCAAKLPWFVALARDARS